MTTDDDIRNLQARLLRMGDTDAAHQVGVLRAAFELACEGAQCETHLSATANAGYYLRLAEEAAGRKA